MTEKPDTYTPILWAVLSDEEQYAEYISARQSASDLLERLLTAIRAIYDVIEKAEDENWLEYNGTDVSRLQGLEDVLETIGQPTLLDAVDPQGQSDLRLSTRVPKSSSLSSSSENSDRGRAGASPGASLQPEVEEKKDVDARMAHAGNK